MSDIVQRLRRKTVAGQPVFPTPLDIEAANEIERLRARVGRDVGDFDYPPGSAPCMCFFSTAEDRGPDPLGECDYHKALRARLAECERLRDIISPGDAAAYEEGMAALLARCETAEARLAEAHALLAHVDELREAAGKVTCERCGGSTCAPEHGRGIPAPGTCPDCDDLRRLLEEKP